MQTLSTGAAYSVPAVAPAVARDLGINGALVGFFISTVYGVGIIQPHAKSGKLRELDVDDRELQAAGGPDVGNGRCVRLRLSVPVRVILLARFGWGADPAAGRADSGRDATACVAVGG